MLVPSRSVAKSQQNFRGPCTFCNITHRIFSSHNEEHSLNNKIKEAPKFYLVYIGSLVLAALIILIPDLPFNFIAVLTQAIGGMLMVPVLIFIMILTNNKKYMGEYKNSLFTNIWGWMVVGVLASLIVMLFYETFWT
ncbi:divalent metal cation transporter [Paenibacillus alvei]|uniref:divalent metal cation transporter n=1 Tax=Paenibacillus alvei TaxID=44250 RepID=UPI002DDCDA91|nr:divalent metal cation transporter [Paenibacillus alvei]